MPTSLKLSLATIVARSGKRGKPQLHDPSSFHPTFAIFAAGPPPWAITPPGFKVFDPMPA
jgi:hypothetical protein